MAEKLSSAPHCKIGTGAITPVAPLHHWMWDVGCRVCDVGCIGKGRGT